ncbi:MAG TPA: CCA tRNA nucleotidyltransferase [Candidatus Hydrogenedentes bacterium]|nr:CCA tRNA nucleotidyltransferase [Candidatus Hydrogenedentota bacterium]HOL75425.1 CCA tRNA nucleotidyltransferase [Candidatus Hydrogenedentota bacterium]HPO84934.1 CCA tRNA nucleotidyltransferase [Candidatus Hydrogenedentota bacterium]
MIDLPDDVRRRTAEQICRRLRDAGFRALLAGGCVRDLLMGISPKDYDIATNARPEEVANLFPRTIPVGAEFGVLKVVCPEGIFEVATFRTDGPYEDGRRPSFVKFSDEIADAFRRDFTINAMFLDPETNEVLDYVGGKQDLQMKIIRTVGAPEKRFEEDYLRLLRAVRFSARLDFQIDSVTEEAILKYAANIVKTSPERIREELVKILTEGNARSGFELLDRTELLPHLLPEVSAMKGVTQPAEFHPEGDVFTHTLLMLEFMQNPSVTLAFGVLLHDIGKPKTWSLGDRIRFNNHDKIGAEIAAEICARLRMSNRETERIVWLVKNHMKLPRVLEMKESKRKRFIREEGFPELLELGRLDCLASHRSLEVIRQIQQYISEQKQETLRPAPLLTGNDLIALGYKPGPVFTEILDRIEDAQLEGIVQTKEQAVHFLRQHWPSP